MRVRMILVPALALAAAFVVWKFTPPSPPTVAATWRVGPGADAKPARQYDELAPETPFRLSLHSSTPQQVYVFSVSAEDGTLLLFPAPGMRSDRTNPVPAGNAVLPGKDGDKDLAWTTRSGVLALTTVIAVAADAPIAEFDALLPKLRHWSNTVFQDGVMNVTGPAEGTAVAGGPHTPVPSPLLQQLLAIQVLDDNNPNDALAPVPGLLGARYCKWMVKEAKKKQ